ncbi:3-deoxy-D-manno-octulosonic acid transferase [Granulicella arctica]|nr:3-deoxy-D-manno-octulosonic acid transferase [Granulicella arctica]
MLLYSSLLFMVLVVGSPYWLVRMLTSGRYRAGLAGRLGRVPTTLQEGIAGRQVVWVHAVSVGELLAATRLVGELEAALGDGWRVVISTTTATGQALARERFGAERVFFYPLDFGWAVRAYLRALRPRLLVLMESELWPRMLTECERAGVPVAVVNARVSDRSFARGVRVRTIWGALLWRVTLFLTQSAADAQRLVAIGAHADKVRVAGNLKYDVRAPKRSRVAELIHEAAAGRRIVVAGSTVEGKPSHEEELVMQAMALVWNELPDVLFVLAPRHPDRFSYAYSLAAEFGVTSATELIGGKKVPTTARRTILLDTIGDLAAVYELANVAFVGGSLVKRGGHNPLEPAQFGVPVVMGGSYENFREIVETMRAEDAVRIVSAEELGPMLLELLTNSAEAQALGERGRRVFASKAGATERVVTELMELLR